MNIPEPNYYYEPTDTSVFLDSEGIATVRFGRATVQLDENTEESKWMQSVFYEIKESQQFETIGVLLDMSRVDAAEYNSDESNTIYKKMLLDPFVSRVAMFGMRPGWELMVELFRFFAKNKLRSFHSEDKARTWVAKKQSV